MKIILCSLVLLFAFCSPFRGLRKKEFVYTTDKVSRSLPLLVPKNYKKEEKLVDNKGNQALVYTYPNGAMLYFANADTLKEYQPINKQLNVRLPHPAGGWMYKGMDSSTRFFWREVKQGNLRFGYRNVSSDLEIKFDSSVNYASYPKVVRRRLRRE